MSEEEFDKCVLCSEDASDTSAEPGRFLLYKDRRALKAVLYELFHHIQIPQEDIPHVFRLCRHGRFCLRCMEMLDSIWSMQMSIAKTQILVQNTAESLGRLIAAAPLFSVQKGLQAKRSKRDRDLWAHMRNPVIQNFAKDLLPLPRVVLSDFVEEKKRKRQRASENNQKNDQKEFVDGNGEAETGLLDISRACNGNFEDEVVRKIDISSPETFHLSPEMKGTRRTKTDDNQILEISAPLNPCTVEAPTTAAQRSPSMIPAISSTTTPVSQSFTDGVTRNNLASPFSSEGLPLPLGQPYAAPGHAVFVSYVPLEAFKEKSNFGAFGSPIVPPANTLVSSNTDASDTSMGNPVGPDLSCKSATAQRQVTSVSSGPFADLTEELDTEEMPQQFLQPRNKGDVQRTSQDADPDTFNIQQVDEANMTEDNITHPTDHSTPNFLPVGNLQVSQRNESSCLLSVRCPKCGFHVEEITKEKSLQKMYVHYGKEHLDVDKEDPCVSEDGLEYFNCQLCPYKSFIIDYSINTRRSSGMGKRQYAIVSLASHCIGVHEPMIKTSVVQPHLRSPAAVSQHRSQCFTCPANKCDFKVEVIFDKSAPEHRRRYNALIKMGHHYLKSHAFPDFPMLDVHHPCYQKSGEKRFFKCPFCSESYVEHAGDKNARQNASKKFMHHLAKSHVLKGLVKSSPKPLLGFQCQECDSVIRTTKQSFRRPSDAKTNLRRQLRKHYLEIHNRKTIPSIDNDAEFLNQSEANNRIDSNSHANGELPEEVSYLRRTKCPLCSFTAAEEKEKPSDPESRFRKLVVHFITHIPVGPSDSSVETEQDDGMICVRNLYKCQQCSFMSRAQTEGSSMTELHEYLSEHYLRFHYPDIDSPPPADSPMSDEDCDDGRADIPSVNTKDIESDECSLYSESMELPLEDDVNNSIKIEERSSCSNWDMAEFENVEVFNVTESTPQTPSLTSPSYNNCARHELIVDGNSAECPPSTSPDYICDTHEPIVVGSSAETSFSSSPDHYCPTDETTAIDPAAVGSSAETSTYNCPTDETTAIDPAAVGSSAETSTYNCPTDETTASDPAAVGSSAETSSTSANHNCPTDETTATDPAAVGSSAETSSTSANHNCPTDETTATNDPTVVGKNAETPLSSPPDHNCTTDKAAATDPIVSEEHATLTTASQPNPIAASVSFMDIRETLSCVNYEWNIVDTTTTEDESS